MTKSRFFFASLFFALSTLIGSASATGVAGFHPECITCHQATPPTADNANPEACVGCHGEAPDKGSVTVDGKTLNPHQGHFDVYECVLCHPAHQPGKIGCLECHKSVTGTIPEK